MSFTIRYISIFCLCSSLILVHISSIFILLRNKKLRDTRFYRLALFLSISDAFIMFFFMMLAAVRNNNAQNLENLNACTILVHLIGGTVISSLAQTLLICLERLNATFTLPRPWLKLITSYISVGVIFIVSQTYALIRGLIDIASGSQSCTVEYTARKSLLLYYDIPGDLLSIAIGLCSGLVILRIYRYHKVSPTNGTQQQPDLLSAAHKRMKKNMITLGCIVITTFLSVSPRVIFGCYIQLSGEMDNNTVNIMGWMNTCLLLNPVVDPFVYLIRIKEFRDFILHKIFRCTTTNTNVIHVQSNVNT